jgi:23S rRNA (cytidine1920-2'-O)/16S rRNA (cytidine1409-2'-O)-methyltransferase
VASRQEAVLAISGGRVLVAGSVADKPARLVAPSDPVVVQGPPRRFVSRGGEKLDAALQEFRIDVAGCRALDAGASTGGFTDCLLQRGAASVIAVDVGHGQLDQRLREDPRVTVRERTNIRDLAPSPSLEPVPVLTADLSFTSLAPLAPTLGRLVVDGGDLVVLVKPQFEAGRAEMAATKGVVRDPEVWRRTVAVVAGALQSAGTGIMGVMISPLTGAAGNTEFLLHAVVGAPALAGPALDDLVTHVVTAATPARKI